MKIKILLTLLLIVVNLSASETLLVLPYCTKNITIEEADELLAKTRAIMFDTDDYSPALTFNTEKLIFEKTNFNNCDYFLTENSSEKFKQIISSTKVDKILSCAFNFENGEYGIFFKLKNGKTGELLKSKAYGFNSSFNKIIQKELKEILHDFFDIQDNRTKYISLSGSFGYLINYSDYTSGMRLGFGSINYGEIALEMNLYTEYLSKNIALTYTTPLKYYLYLKIGIGFTSEKKDGFSLTKYNNAPSKDEIIEMKHSVSTLTALGLSIPITKSFRVNIAAETDLIYCEYKYLDNTTKKSLIYSYYPEIEISYLIKF